MYFCCVEAVQNAAKHAGADAVVTVGFRKTEDEVVFEVEDDGRGFDVRAAPRGRGLENIADRLATAGGSLELDSAPGAGTRITGRIPGH